MPQCIYVVHQITSPSYGDTGHYLISAFYKWFEGDHSKQKNKASKARSSSFNHGTGIIQEFICIDDNKTEHLAFLDSEMVQDLI